MMVIIFKNLGDITGKRNIWHRGEIGEMKFINQRKERKGCTTFTTRIASKSKTLRLKQRSQWATPESISLGPSLAPWKVVCARNAEADRAEIGSSICSSHDVGQCVTSSKR